MALKLEQSISVDSGCLTGSVLLPEDGQIAAAARKLIIDKDAEAAYLLGRGDDEPAEFARCTIDYFSTRTKCTATIDTGGRWSGGVVKITFEKKMIRECDVWIPASVSYDLVK